MKMLEISLQEQKKVAEIIREIVNLNGFCNKEDEQRIDKIIDSIRESVERHFKYNCEHNSGEPVIKQLASGKFEVAYDFIWNFYNNSKDSWVNNADFVADFIHTDNAGIKWLEVNRHLL